MSDTALRVALVGSPNAGKTTLFNALTGSSAKVANYPGVTVEGREGRVVGSARAVTLLDLPGTYSLRAEAWLYPGMAGWHFLTVPKTQGKEIKGLFGDAARGWGSLPVRVTIGATSWTTSIFPDKKSGSYVLPLKLVVRKAEGIEAGDCVAFTLEVGA